MSIDPQWLARADDDRRLRRILRGLPPEDLPADAYLAHAVERAFESDPITDQNFVGWAKQAMRETFGTSTSAWRILARVCESETNRALLTCDGGRTEHHYWDPRYDKFAAKILLLSKPVVHEGAHIQSVNAHRLWEWTRLAQALAPFFDADAAVKAFYCFLAPTPSILGHGATLDVASL